MTTTTSARNCGYPCPFFLFLSSLPFSEKEQEIAYPVGNYQDFHYTSLLGQAADPHSLAGFEHDLGWVSRTYA
jgi:hypothetical protein